MQRFALAVLLATSCIAMATEKVSFFTCALAPEADHWALYGKVWDSGSFDVAEGQTHLWFAQWEESAPSQMDGFCITAQGLPGDQVLVSSNVVRAEKLRQFHENCEAEGDQVQGLGKTSQVLSRGDAFEFLVPEAISPATVDRIHTYFLTAAEMAADRDTEAEAHCQALALQK